MADTEIGSMFVTFGADLSDLQDGISQAQSLLSDFGSSLTDMGASFKSILGESFSSLPTLDTSGVTDGVTLISDELQSLGTDASEAFSSLTDVPTLDTSGVTGGVDQVSEDLLSLQADAMEAISSMSEMGNESADLGEKLSETASGPLSSLSGGIKNAFSGMQNMAQGAMDGIKGAFTSAKPSLSDFASSIGQAGSSVLGFAGSIAGMAGIHFPNFSDPIGLLNSTLSESINIAQKHQTIMDQTTRTLSATGNASGQTAQSIEKLATSFSQNTKFSEDTIQSGENLLLTFNKIGGQTFPDATKAMLDMSQALGINTTKAAKDLGKALEDPLKAVKDLTKEHVPFTAAQQKSIQTMMAHNDVAGAQKVILQAVEGAFGGAAQAAGQTFSGQLQILQNSMNNVKEKIGTALLPILGQLTGAITSTVLPAINGFSDWLSSPAFQNFATGVGKSISDAFSSIGGVLKTIDWKTIGNDFSSLGNSLGSILAGLKPPNNNLFKDIGGVLKTVVDDTGGFAKGLGEVIGWFNQGSAPATALKDALIGIGIAIGLMKIGQFVATIPGLIAQLGIWAAGQWTVAAATIATALPYLAIGAIVVGVIALIVLAVTHWGDISKWLVNAWGAVSKFFQGLWADISKIFGGIGNWFHDRWDEAAKGTQSAFGNTGKWFQDRGKDIQNTFGGMGNWFHDRFTEASKGVQDAFGGIGKFLMGQWNDQVQGWKIIGQWFHDRFTEAWNGITNVFQHIGQYLMNIWNTEVQGWKNVGAWFQVCFTNAWNAVTSIFQHIGQYLMGIWDNEVQGWKNIGAWFHDRFTEAWNAVTGVFGGVGNWFHDQWTTITNDFNSVLGGLGTFASNIWNSVTGAVRAGFNYIISLVNGVISHIDSIQVAGFGVNIPLIPYLASGVENFVGGLALVGEKGPELVNLPRGANVLNHDKTASLFSGMNNNFKYPSMAGQASFSPQIIVHVHNDNPAPIYIDGHELTNSMAPHIANMIRLKGDVRSR